MEILNHSSDKQVVIEELKTIPGVGDKIAEMLWQLGIRSISDLSDKKPETLYNSFCKIKNRHIDRCLLYVFRCAVYYASTEPHDEELLKWWNWKDK